MNFYYILALSEILFGQHFDLLQFYAVCVN